MAFKTLTILEKNIGDPLDSVLTTRRTAAPQIIQPTYTFDPSDMYGFFVPCASLSSDFIWWDNHLYVDVSLAGADWLFALKDVSVIDVSAYDGLLWNDASNRWNNVRSIDFDDLTYSKEYLDPFISNTNNTLYEIQSNMLDSSDLYPFATNASVGLALGSYATNASVGLALGPYATNASINAAGFATNSSVNIAAAQFVKSASIGDGLIWNNGVLDVSAVYKDASIITFTVSLSGATFKSSSFWTDTEVSVSGVEPGDCVTVGMESSPWSSSNQGMQWNYGFCVSSNKVTIRRCAIKRGTDQGIIGGTVNAANYTLVIYKIT